ncbi:MAG: hypothetical protein HQK49_02290 [Oligoflexia bacterium]|nr:hypothetical protein [Oligoflexia bacterium]
MKNRFISKSMLIISTLALVFMLSVALTNNADAAKTKKKRFYKNNHTSRSISNSNPSVVTSASKACKVKKGFTKEELIKELAGLNYCELVDRTGRDPEIKLPSISKEQDKLAGKEIELDINDIHYMQGNCSNTTKDGIYTVIQNAKDIKAGKLDIKVIPRIGVWKDTTGRIWTVDHRRLASFVLSGSVKKVPAVWLDSKTVIHDKFKYSNKENGNKMVITVGKKGVVIERDTSKDDEKEDGDDSDDDDENESDNENN